MSTFRTFSGKFLSKLENAKFVEADVKPQLVYNEAKSKSFWRPPRLSRRIQADLRKACIQEGIEPTSIGLLPETAPKSLRYKPNKLEKHERTRAERQATIQRNMEKMPQTIQAWKEVNERDCQYFKLITFYYIGKIKRTCQTKVFNAILDFKHYFIINLYVQISQNATNLL